MSDQLIIHYSVENGGDGSAYPRFFDTEKLAEWHQEHLDEGWGEPCTGRIIVEGDNLYCPKLQTKEGYYLELLEDSDDDNDRISPFVSEFFPEGLPEFTVGIIEHHYYDIFVAGSIVDKWYAYPEKNANKEGVERLTTFLDDKTKQLENKS